MIQVLPYCDRLGTRQVTPDDAVDMQWLPAMIMSHISHLYLMVLQQAARWLVLSIIIRLLTWSNRLRSSNLLFGSTHMNFLRSYSSYSLKSMREQFYPSRRVHGRGRNQSFYGWPETVAQWVEVLLGALAICKKPSWIAMALRSPTNYCNVSNG